MRKYLLVGVAFAALTTGSAMAADMSAPVYKAPPPPPPPPVYNWTGFYIGAHVGGAFSEHRFRDRDGAFTGFPGFELGKHDASGIIGGGQIGVNWQGPGTNWVIGVEAQFSGADLSGDHVDPFTGARFDTKVDWLGSVAGRLGYAWNNVLVYGKGGVAFAHHKFGFGDSTDPFFADHLDKTRTGWMAGGGIEIGLPGNWLNGSWSIKGEYNFMQFNRHDADFFIDGDAFRLDVRNEIHVVKFGLNYRFGAPAPVVARY